MADDSAGAELGSVAIMKVLLENKNKKAEPEFVRIRFDRIRGLLPEGLEEDEIEDWLIERFGELLR